MLTYTDLTEYGAVGTHCTVGFLTGRCHWVILNGISLHSTSYFLLYQMLASLGSWTDSLFCLGRDLNRFSPFSLQSRYGTFLDTAIQPQRNEPLKSRDLGVVSLPPLGPTNLPMYTKQKKNPTDRREPVQTRKDGLVACPKHLLAQLPSSRGSQLWPIQCLYAPFHVQEQEASTQSHPCSLDQPGPHAAAPEYPYYVLYFRHPRKG